MDACKGTTTTWSIVRCHEEVGCGNGTTVMARAATIACVWEWEQTAHEDGSWTTGQRSCVVDSIRTGASRASRECAMPANPAAHSWAAKTPHTVPRRKFMSVCKDTPLLPRRQCRVTLDRNANVEWKLAPGRVRILKARLRADPLGG